MKPANTADCGDPEPVMAATDNRYTFKATWRAMFHLPCDRFPLLLAHVHPVAGPFILWQLKGKGYSDCRVVSESGGLRVFADR